MSQANNVSGISNRGVIAVIIPVYNERGTVHELLETVARQAAVGQVLIVDDGSTDGSYRELKRWGTKNTSAQIIRHSRNYGKGKAIRTALEHVKKPYVIIQDADLEYDPADYMSLLEPVQGGTVDVVYGTRFARTYLLSEILHFRWQGRAKSGCCLPA